LRDVKQLTTITTKEVNLLAGIYNPAATSRSVQSEAPTMSRWQENFTILDVAILLAARKRFVLLVSIGFGVFAAIVVLLIPNRYTATTVILPPQQSSSASSLVLSQLGSLGSIGSLSGEGLGVKNPNDLYVALLKTETVENAMIHRFDLMAYYHTKKLSMARKALESHCDIAAGIKDGLIRVSVKDKSPQHAAQMANAYIEEFKKQSATLAITEAGQRRMFFDEQLAEAKENLSKAEESLKTTEEKTGMLELTGQSRALIESVAALRAQIAAKEVELRAMESYATSQNSEVVRAQGELAGLQTQLSRLAGTSPAGSSSDVSDQLILADGKVPEAGLEYLRKLRDVKYDESVLEFLAKQVEAAKIDEAKQGAIIQVVDRAEVPDTKSFPYRSLVVLAATAFGFFAAILWLTVKKLWSNLHNDPDLHRKLDALNEALWVKPHAG
jgi:tyrosine-protein kinase Etk/Wzc